MRYLILFFSLSSLLSSCSSLKKNERYKAMAIGAATGTLAAMATQNNQDNKSLYVANGFALGALFGWTYSRFATSSDDSRNSNLNEQIKTLQIIKTQQNSPTIKTKAVNQWQVESEKDNIQNLIYIKEQYEISE